VPARKTSDGRTPDGKWIDRWFEGARKRQRTFDRKGDRDAFRARRRRAEQLGHDLATELLLEDDLTLSAWCEEWWARHAVPNLERQTRTSYKQQWGKWIQPRLGDYELRALTPRVINTQLVQAMRKAGAGEPTIRRCLAITQSMLRLAVVEERIASNPVDLLDKPSPVPERHVDPIAPAVVEGMRRAAIARRGPLGASDAFIIAMLAYAGLRPQELLALEWDDVLTDVAKLFITRKNVDGQVFPYLKSGRRHRNRRHRRVDLFEPLAADLRAHRMRSGARRGLVLARPDGAPWRKHDWDNWRKRVWQPLAVDADLGELVDQGVDDRRATRGRTRTRCAARSCRCWSGRAARCSRSPLRPGTASTCARCTTRGSSRATTRRAARAPRRRSWPLAKPKDVPWTPFAAKARSSKQGPRT
jgi:integrase